ncbi:MAG TPA: acyl-CoA dehydrogenase family protein [Rhizomicrobium sp.]|jgi:alkylation response protein AidB-like acyl-CoA dehydrogenase
MILDKKDDLPAFRSAIRQWLADVLPPDWHTRMARATPQEEADFQRWWMGERHKVGLATPHWPREYGGSDLHLEHEIIIADEFARANAPSSGMYIIALNHIPATLLAWGTQAQKDKYLPGVARGEVWCQGFSEPNAGSDLASLRTRAVLDGDHYVVNGQKIWSSRSMFADYCILLARTDPASSKHHGISYFILDMKAPGVEVRPIRQATGEANFGEIFLTDVHIPVENLVGEENKGWTVAQSTLAAERGVLAFEGAERRRYAYEKFYKAVLERRAEWLEDGQLRREFIQLFAEMQAGRRLVRQLLKENAKPKDQQTPSMTPACVKISSTTLMQKFGDLLARLEGLESQKALDGARGVEGDPMYEYLGSFGQTIAAGTNEVMRNIIAERGLGLPR